jgi:hypothetical protein
LNHQELQSGVKEGRFSVALEAADNGKVYYPNYGNPFRVVSHSPYDLIDRCFMEVEERNEKGIMEAGVGAPKCSGCEDLYRLSGKSVPLLLTVCIGLVASDEDDRILIANFENDELYRDQPAGKSLVSQSTHDEGRDQKKGHCQELECLSQFLVKDEAL